MLGAMYRCASVARSIADDRFRAVVDGTGKLIVADADHDQRGVIGIVILASLADYCVRLRSSPAVWGVSGEHDFV